MQVIILRHFIKNMPDKIIGKFITSNKTVRRIYLDQHWIKEQHTIREYKDCSILR